MLGRLTSFHNNTLHFSFNFSWSITKKLKACVLSAAGRSKVSVLVERMVWLRVCLQSFHKETVQEDSSRKRKHRECHKAVPG